ncbi:sensor histidine kinase [Pseudorhodoferax sp.]|uniref:sensor histidine kinase n=1 Tax=Pseudorhodoferax sp. TaxID=1993553 RepID=UPI002DD65672|nr:ATP-binding protein [Pseudorhodoferax sp.]
MPQTLAQLPQQAFVPFDGLLARGYGRCAIWVRLQLAPADGPAVLRIRPTYLDEIALHDPLQPGVQLAGDRHAPDPAARSRAITFNLPGSAAPRTVWLRLSTSSTRMLDIQAMSPQEALVQDRREDWGQGVFLVLLATPLLWAVLQWWHQRERVLGAFALKQTVTLAWTLLLHGYGPGLPLGLAPAVLDRLTSVLVLATVASSVWFDRALLSGYQVPRWGPRVLLAVVALAPLELVLLFSDQAHVALALNITAGWLAVLLTCVLYLLARPAAGLAAASESLHPRVLAGFYALILAATSLAAGTQLGLLHSGPPVLWALYAHGLLTGVFMMVLLHARAGRQARALGALAAAQERVAQERRSREEQERLVGMLVHEMRTPLATVRMLLGDGRPSPQQFDSVQRSLADMNGVLERCAQASQLDGDGLQPQWSRCDLRQTVQDIAAGWREAPRLAVLPGGAPAPVQVDAQWLRIILGNLIDNACKYSPAGSRVQLSLAAHTDLQDPARPRAGFVVDVANLPGAAGWPDAQRLFAKYYRSPFARRSTGSGLGLYLVAGLARRLDGHIRYEPTPEQVRFRLWLPA